MTGLVMAAGTLALFRWELDQTGSLTRAQTVALTTMVLFQVFHVGNCRSDYVSVFKRNPFSNPFLFVAVAATIVVAIEVHKVVRRDQSGGTDPDVGRPKGDIVVKGRWIPLR